MLKLLRYNYADTLTQGLFFIDGEYIGDALELAWRDNQHDISCIPEGRYPLEYGIMSDGLKGYRVLNVDERSGIWIHPASNTGQIRGCIGTGIKYGNLLYYNTEVMKRICSKLGNTSVLTIVKAGKDEL